MATPSDLLEVSSSPVPDVAFAPSAECGGSRPSPQPLSGPATGADATTGGHSAEVSDLPSWDELFGDVSGPARPRFELSSPKRSSKMLISWPLGRGQTPRQSRP